jgi:hypothetical protein
MENSYKYNLMQTLVINYRNHIWGLHALSLWPVAEKNGWVGWCLGVFHADSPVPLHCVVGPDPVEGRPCSATTFLDLGLALKLLVLFGVVDHAGLQRMAWGLLARLQ